MSDWFADEEFWETFYPYLFTEERFAGADEEVEKVLGLTRAGVRDVLDLACGPGRHVIALAEKGFQVTGVDLSDFLLTKAKNRAGEKGLEVTWLREDMRNFHREEAFDLAISLFSSFGYFEDDADNLDVLRHVCASLRTGGELVLDTNGKESLARQFKDVLYREFEDGTILVDHPTITEGWKRATTEWILIRGETIRRFEYSVRLFSGEEMERLLREAGFSKVRLFGDLSGNTYGLDAKKLVAVATK